MINVDWKKVESSTSNRVVLPEWIGNSRPSNRRNIYLYFDESGNFDFRESGTPYFIMTCAATERPFSTATMLTNLRYDLIEHGVCLEQFHACEDKKEIRTAVYDILGAVPGSYRVYSVYVDKKMVPSEYQSPEAIYSKIFGVLMDEVYEKEIGPSTEKVIAITDDLPKDAKRKQVTKPLKAYMRSRFQNTQRSYQLLHHKSCSDPNLQAVDYFCWAAHRDLTQSKSWPLSVCADSFREVGEVEFTD